MRRLRAGLVTPLRRAPATVRAHKGWLRRSARHTLGFMPGVERGLRRTRRRKEYGRWRTPPRHSGARA